MPLARPSCRRSAPKERDDAVLVDRHESGLRAGAIAAHQIGPGVDEGEGPLEALHESGLDA